MGIAEPGPGVVRLVMGQVPVSPLVWASMTRATASRSTSLLFLRAASRRAAVAIRSVSRMPPSDAPRWTPKTGAFSRDRCNTG